MPPRAAPPARVELGLPSGRLAPRLAWGRPLQAALVGVLIVVGTLGIGSVASAAEPPDDGQVSVFQTIDEELGEGCSPTGTLAGAEIPRAPSPCDGTLGAGPNEPTDGLEVTSLAVPISLVEGASALAPLLVHALDGSSLTALPGDVGDFGHPTALAADGTDRPSQGSSPSSDAALPTPCPPPCQVGILVLELTMQPDEAARPTGYAARVYRPPRS